MQIPYIDIHTHKPYLDENIKSIEVIDLSNVQIPKNQLFCLGIHPWFIKDHSEKTLVNLLTQYRLHSNFVALGEIGLDKTIRTSLEKQKEVFENQLTMAKEYQITTLILHNVKSYSETLELLKKNNYQGKILLHDFRGHLDIYKQYSKHYPTYLGIGPHNIFNSKDIEWIKSLPKQYIFLETDDQTNYSIQELYEEFSLITKQDIKDILKSFADNFDQFILS